MADFATLAHHYANQPVVGWFMSRKLNGWRCLWDGGVTRGVPLAQVPWSKDMTAVCATGLWTLGRSAGPKPIFAPDWFLNQLPEYVPLDGELWHETDNISIVKSICGQGEEKGRIDPRWRGIKYMVFNSKPYSLWGCVPDSPFYPNGSWLYRMELVKKRITSSLQERDNLEVLEQVKVESTKHVFEYKRYVGGEGIMLVNPNAQYELCRSYNLLKVKTFYETEATVIGYEDGQNRHLGRMGSVIAKLTWDEKVTSLYGGKPEFVGKTVSFGIGGGFTDEQREWSYVSQNFPIGSEIHFSYLGVSSEGVPVSCNHIQD